MIEEFNAVKTMLSGVSLLSGSVFTPDDPEPVRGTYVLLFPAGPEDMDDDRYGSVTVAASDSDYSFPVRVVSSDVNGVLLAADAVKGLVGSKPTVSGRKCGPVRVDFDPAKKDTSVSPPLFFMDMWIEFTSRRG